MNQFCCKTDSENEWLQKESAKWHLVYIVLAMIIAPMLKLENKFSLQKTRNIF